MRNIEKTNNSRTWQFFENLRNFEKLLIFKFDYSKILRKFWQFRKLSNFYNLIFFLKLKDLQNSQNLLIKKTLKIQKISNLENYKKLEP